MRIFDTKIQRIKHEVLRETARYAREDRLADAPLEIPQRLITGEEATMRCCVYKERAVIGERIRLAMGGNQHNKNVIEVLPIACDECPGQRYEVTDMCRGCIAHPCEDTCRFGAISFGRRSQKAIIDADKCAECGLCAKACPYGAIISNQRPCERACKTNAVSQNIEKKARIEEAKCVGCGACVIQCPFGAMMDKSSILTAVSLLKNRGENPLYAVLAPSFACQFDYANLGQVIAGIKALGFTKVMEAALGADMTAMAEAEELSEKGFLLSSCCPAFVDYVRKFFPTLTRHISQTPSPMAILAKWLKAQDPAAKIVFIGPCTAKKNEAEADDVSPYVDCVLTFEELQALMDSDNIDLSQLPMEMLDTASYFGRSFAASGGLSNAVVQAAKEQNLAFSVRPLVCSGLDECKVALLKAARGILKENFVEGMACAGGCIGGAGCLTHHKSDRADIEKFSRQALSTTIQNAITQNANP